MRFLFNSEKSGLSSPQPYPVSARVPELHDAELAAVYYGQRMGGDFYDFLRVSPNRVLFGLLDVAGQFNENGLITSSAQQTFRTLGTQLLAAEEVNEADAMIELYHQLNRTILNAAGKVRSCPGFAGCYNESLGIICYFNAGHIPGLLRDGGGVAELPATGLPLGLFSHATCDAYMTTLQPGASLLLVSRGIVESKCGGEELGLESVKELFQRSRAEGAKELCLAVLDHVQQFMCTPPTHNDVTALSLTRHSASAPTRN